MTVRAAPPRRLLADARTGQPLTLLLVDDDEIGIRALRRVLDRIGLVNPVRVARDGVEALETLHALRGRGGTLSPTLMLLDLKMPRMDGLELLGRIRADAALAALPVIVLTTSDAPRDIGCARSTGVIAYLLKEENLVARLGALFGAIGDRARLVDAPTVP